MDIINFFIEKLIKLFSMRKQFGVFAFRRRCSIHARAKIHNFVILDAVVIGDMSYVANFSRIKNCRIGKFSSIGPNVIIGLGIHPSNWVSSHPSFFSSALQSGKSFVRESRFVESLEVLIGNDVWVGHGALILDGVTIGDGAIVGAGAVVTRDVPPYSIVVGVPAKVVKYRFLKEDISFLQSLKWWDKSDQWLEENVDLFCNLEALKASCSEAMI